MSTVLSKNPTPNALRTRRWRERHREKSREYQRLYQQKLRQDPEHRAKEAAKLRERYAANPEYHRARALRWAKENPAKACAQANLRRARLAGAEGSYTAEEFAAVCEAHGNLCAYCGEERPLCADHVIPITRGGSNYIENIVPACRSCNSRKGARTADEYLALKAA